MSDCVFCDKIAANDVEEVINFSARFVPLNPVVEGHMLFVPTFHAEHPSRSGLSKAMYAAQVYAAQQGEDYNLITSSGYAATQSIPHMHVHYVPRTSGDGLHLPWTNQHKDRSAP